MSGQNRLQEKYIEVVNVEEAILGSTGRGEETSKITVSCVTGVAQIFVLSFIQKEGLHT